MRHYFGTDGVRGIANQELTPEMAFKLGRCGGAVLLRHAPCDGVQPRVLVGRDTRISGQMLEHALIAGLLSAGLEVYQLGIIPTPAVAYLTQSTGATAGVMISASHNPVQDNGIKFFGADGFKLSDEQEEEIEALIDSAKDDLPRPSAEGLGTTHVYPEGVAKYLEFLCSTIRGDLSGLRIGIDGANGATAPILSRLFADLGVEFTSIGTKTDGLSINDGVGSTHPEALVELVKSEGLDAGVAFDGDGDRCQAVDELGRVIDGDHIMLICAHYLKNEGLLAHNTVVATVMSNLGFYKALESYGIDTVTTQVGDRYVVEAMRKGDYKLGGEQSGHVIFMDHNTTGDGLLTAIQLLYVLKESGKKLSELADLMTSYPQKLINVPITRGDKQDVLNGELITEAIKAAEDDLADAGRILVRPSGTENLLRVMVEAESEIACHTHAENLANLIREHYGS